MAFQLADVYDVDVYVPSATDIFLYYILYSLYYAVAMAPRMTRKRVVYHLA